MIQARQTIVRRILTAMSLLVLHLSMSQLQVRAVHVFSMVRIIKSNKLNLSFSAGKLAVSGLSRPTLSAKEKKSNLPYSAAVSVSLRPILSANEKKSSLVNCFPLPFSVIEPVQQMRYKCGVVAMAFNMWMKNKFLTMDNYGVRRGKIIYSPQAIARKYFPILSTVTIFTKSLFWSICIL